MTYGQTIPKLLNHNVKSRFTFRQVSKTWRWRIKIKSCAFQVDENGFSMWTAIVPDRHEGRQADYESQSENERRAERVDMKLERKDAVKSWDIIIRWKIDEEEKEMLHILDRKENLRKLSTNCKSNWENWGNIMRFINRDYSGFFRFWYEIRIVFSCF